MKNLSHIQFIAVCLVLTGLSCNIFEPREAESPSQSGFQYLPLTDPSYVISNLQRAIANTDPLGYMRCFPDTSTGQSFVFVPSADASTAFPRPWSLEKESMFFTDLANQKKPGGQYGLYLIFGPDSLAGSNSRTYNCSYVFKFDHLKSSFSSTTAIGLVQFVLTPDRNSNWHINSWVDTKSGDSLTFTSFKENFP